MLSVRISDVAVGLCPCPPSPSPCPATGVVVSGNPLDFVGGMPKSRMGDIVLFPCGGFVITIGNPLHISGGMPAAVIGAPCVGAGIGNVVSGFPSDLII